MALGSVVVNLAVDLARFRSDMGQAAAVSNTRLREIERSVAQTTRQISSVGRSIRNAFATIGVGVSLVAIKNAAMAAIEYGDQIAKAAEKTGIAADAFSELAFAAKMQDIELSSLSTGLKKFQVSISEAGSGSKSALEKFAALGIEFERFRQLSPDRQFEVLAEQISKLKDPADRTRAAVEFFGKAGADLLPLFSQGAEGIRKAREEAVKLGVAMSNEQVKKLADADDAIKRLSQSWDGFARTLTIKVAPILTKILDSLVGDTDRAATARITQIQQLLAGRAGQPEALFNDTAALKRELAQLEEARLRAITGGVRRAGGPGVRGLGDPVGFLPDPAKVKEMTRAQLAGLSELAITVQQVSVSATEQLYRDMDTATQTSIQRQLAQWNELSGQLEELAQPRLIRQFDENGGSLIVQQAGLAAEEVNARMAEVNAKFLSEIEITAEKIFPETEREKLSVFAEEAGRNLQSAFADYLFDPFKDGLDGMLKGFLDTIRRMIAELAAAEVLKSFFGFAAGATGGGISKLFSGLAAGIGLRESGGPVTAGSAYIIGEKRAEMFVPGMNGRILPGVPGGGGMTVNYNVDARGATMELAKALPGILQENNRQLVAFLDDRGTR